MGEEQCGKCGGTTAPLLLCRGCGADYVTLEGDLDGELRPAQISQGTDQPGWLVYEPGRFDDTGTGYDADQDDQDTLTGGVCGLTCWDAWVVRYGITGFYGWHTYQGLTGLSLQDHETASYDSYGATATAATGPVPRYGFHAFLPEAGATWLWAHRNRYTTEATDPSRNTTFSALDDHDVYVEAAVRWLGSMLLGNIHVLPTASIGVRYLLTDANVGVVQSIPGAAPVLVESRQDRMDLTLSGGVVLTKARHTVSSRMMVSSRPTHSKTACG